MLNKAMIIGRLGRDPELKRSQNGTAVCAMRIATDESYTDRDGNRVDRAEWHTVTAFAKLAETCAQNLRKGRLVYVEGTLQTRKWQDPQGQERASTEIRAQRVQFLDKGEAQTPLERSQIDSKTRSGSAPTFDLPYDESDYRNTDNVPF